MIELVLLIAPIILLVGIGYLAVRIGMAGTAQIEGLGMFVLNFALPALILNALSRQDLGQTFNGRYILAYAAGSLAAFFAVFILQSRVFGKPLSQAAIGGLGGSASNTGFIGFPVASLTIGAAALTAMPLTMIVENFLIIPLALALAEAGREDGNSLAATILSTLKRLSRMPIILAIILGAALSASGIHLPGPLATVVDMTAKASAPCALFVVGGTVAGLHASGKGAMGMAGDLATIIPGKLVLHPIAVAIAFWLIGGVSGELVATGILFASVPMFTVYPILARRFGSDGAAATALIVATVIGFVA
ncbi:MAG: AEC family transporter, partial [Nitratireductor sp.]|nr:AEC family transporter [Nitratireductor sp.]